MIAIELRKTLSLLTAGLFLTGATAIAGNSTAATGDPADYASATPEKHASQGQEQSGIDLPQAPDVQVSDFKGEARSSAPVRRIGPPGKRAMVSPARGGPSNEEFASNVAEGAEDAAEATREGLREAADATQSGLHAAGERIDPAAREVREVTEPTRLHEIGPPAKGRF